MNCYSRLNRGVAFHLSGEFLTSLLASKSNQESISILGTRVQTKLQKNVKVENPTRVHQKSLILLPPYREETASCCPHRIFFLTNM